MENPEGIAINWIGRKGERRDMEDSLDSGQEPGVCRWVGMPEDGQASCAMPVGYRSIQQAVIV